MESNVVSINSFNTPKQVNVVSEYWKTIIGTRLTPEGERLLSWWRGKVSDEDFFYAIDETALAPQPSIRYTIAILRRIAAEKGVIR